MNVSPDDVRPDDVPDTDAWREAQAELAWEQYLEALAEGSIDRCCNGSKCRLAVGDPRHGTANGYNNLGCRCQPCRHAWAENYRVGPLGRAVDKYRARLAADGLTTNNGQPRQVPYRQRLTRIRPPLPIEAGDRHV